MDLEDLSHTNYPPPSQLPAPTPIMPMSCLNQMSWIWRIFFFLTAQFLEVCSFLMVNEHIYKFNRIVNLWNYLPFCLLSHKGGVKAGMFQGNNMCSVHMCGRLQLHCRSTKYWTFLLFGHLASFLKETVGVDGQRKWHVKRRNRDFENSLGAIISPFQTTLCLGPSLGPEDIRHFNDKTFYLLCYSRMDYRLCLDT